MRSSVKLSLVASCQGSWGFLVWNILDFKFSVRNVQPIFFPPTPSSSPSFYSSPLLAHLLFLLLSPSPSLYFFKFRLKLMLLFPIQNPYLIHLVFVFIFNLLGLLAVAPNDTSISIHELSHNIQIKILEWPPEITISVTLCSQNPLCPVEMFFHCSTKFDSLFSTSFEF